MRIEDLLHRVNNLLAVIQTQVEVARITGTEVGQRAALEAIEAAGARTGRDVRQFREGRERTA